MKILTAAAGLAAVLAVTGAAMAAPVQGPLPQQPAHRGQYASNRNLQIASNHVERAIDSLQQDQEDYGGHRVAAINDLSQAREDLASALEYWRSHNGRTGTGAVPVSGRPIPASGTLPVGNPVGVPVATNDQNNEFERNQRQSNRNLEAVSRHVERAIDALERDSTDYGGFKEKAVDRLQAARAELDAAIDYRNKVVNGGNGQVVSDQNLQFVNGNIEAAIDRLSGDRHDYGGHRATAIDDLQQARGDIQSALAYDRSHDNTRGVAGGAGGGVLPIGSHPLPNQPLPGAAAPAISQGASNDSIADVRNHVETAIDALQRDRHDYGGFREKAIDRLQAARSELLQALQFEHAH